MGTVLTPQFIIPHPASTAEAATTVKGSTSPSMAKEPPRCKDQQSFHRKNGGKACGIGAPLIVNPIQTLFLVGNTWLVVVLHPSEKIIMLVKMGETLPQLLVRK